MVADDPTGPLTDARAWIDDLRLGAPSGPVVPTDTTPPTLAFTAPADGATISGIVRVKVDATDDDMVSQVFLFLGSDLIASDYVAPFEFLWDTAVFPDGPQTLNARAFDRAGNLTNATLMVNVTRAPPVEEEDPAGQPGTVSAGRRYWGCTTSGSPADVSLLAMVGALAVLLARRRV